MNWAVPARWLDVTLYAFLAWVVLMVVSAPIVRSLQPIANALAQLGYVPVLAVIAVLYSLWAWRKGRSRWRALFGVRHPIRRPPIMLSAVLAIGILWWCPPSVLTLSDEAGRLLGRGEVLSLASIVLVLLVTSSFQCLCDTIAQRVGSEATTPSAAPPIGLSAIAGDYARLVEWARTDDVPDAKTFLALGHEHIATRIAARLREASPPTIAVVGDIGSGKSTIRARVEYELRDRPDRVLCSLSLWQYENERAAIRAIIDELLDGLRKHTSTLSIAGIPRHYIEAISHGIGPLAFLSALISHSKSPKETLAEISRVAGAICVHLVVWVEDLERFGGLSSIDSSDHATDDKLSLIRSSLYLLDTMPNISVLVSDSTLRSRFDQSKIARFVERTPRLEPDDITRIVESFRERHLFAGHAAFIDPKPVRERERFLPRKEPAWGRLPVGYHLNHIAQAGQCFGYLITTPRQLKGFIRLVDQNWATLKGEIDFDDLLVLSVLRLTRPRIYAFIDEHIDTLRLAPRKASELRGTSDGQPKHPVIERLHDILNLEESHTVRLAIEALLRHLFMDLLDGKDPQDHERDSRPQSVMAFGQVDYYRRMQSGSADDDFPTDQSVLRSIQSWRAGEQCDLVNLLTNPVSVGRIEHFVKMFEKEDLPRLIRESARAQSAYPYDDDSTRDTPTGLVEVWRMCHRLHPDRAQLKDVLLEIIDVYLETNLPLAFDYLYYYVSDSRESRVPDLVEREQRKDIEGFFVDGFDKFVRTSSVEKFLGALRQAQPWVLLQSAYGLSRLRADDLSEMRIKSWDELRAKLIAAFDVDEKRGLELVTVFITEMKDRAPTIDRPRDRVPRFDEKLAKRLFPDDSFDELLDRLRRPIDLDRESSELGMRMAAAVDYARAHAAGG